jgi:hypothetical protein
MRLTEPESLGRRRSERYPARVALGVLLRGCWGCQAREAASRIVKRWVLCL